MSDIDTLLFPVFDVLRRKGVPLGVPDYLAVVEAIHAGLGLDSQNSLKNLCCLLWTKSKEDQELFSIEFTELVEPRLKGLIKSSPSPSGSSGKTIKQSEGLSSYTPPANSIPSMDELEEQLKNHLPESSDQAVETSLSAPVYPKREKVAITDHETHKIHEKRYNLTPKLPFSQREMAGIWRHLKRPQRSGALEDLDVEETIKFICRTGTFIEPVLQPRRCNQAGLVVLVDRTGSMAPLEPWMNATIESISRGGLLRKLSFYYFHNYPGNFLYQYPGLTNPLPLETALDSQGKDNGVLIISDAGAARGYYNSKRLAATKEFIKILGSYTYLYSWLNPIPYQRWKNSTAEGVAKLLPMFYLDRDGLNDAVNILRGHPFPPEVCLYD
ncbi:hypothetical protein NDA01_24315 [Trichocoleus desertorum AS-A10]|uniref:hypothetical protein n=1 Tax=Trichocoleus desertorum TaxID=1481672 RepID=UPI003298CA0F